MHQVRSLDTTPSVTDLFCGCGGSSAGADRAGADVELALNHWDLAVRTHNENHPHTSHDCVDVSACRPDRYPTTRLLWASPECTNHSLAKGTKYQQSSQGSFDFSDEEPDPARVRSRCTMWDVPRFAEWHDYEICVVENVPDARKWRLWDAWIKAMGDLGYDYQPLYLNSMFFHPTPQSRDRMYVVFWKEGNERPNLDFRPPAWCTSCRENVQSVQSWRDTDYGRRRIGLRYGVQYEYRCPHCSEVVEPYYYASFNAIDWSVDAEKIGERDRPLAERTMERIEHGLEEYGRDPLVITTRYTSGLGTRVRGAPEDPLPTQPADNSHAVCRPPASAALVAPFLQKQNGGTQRGWPLTDPIGAQTTSLSDGLVGLPPQVVSVNDFDSRTLESTSEAYPTQTTQTKWSVLRPPAFRVELHGTSDAAPLTGANGCVLAGGNHHALVDTRAFLSYYFSSGHQNSGMEEPAGTVTTRDRAALVRIAKEKAKDVRVEECTFRMLKPHEIKAAMAFSSEYTVYGTNREKVKQLGNAVTPPVARDIIDRCLQSLDR